jgi:hypothetical protein
MAAQYANPEPQADSVEKTQLNVAVSYMAILLGYLCLSGSTRRRFDTLNRGAGVGCLVESIREFMHVFASVDGKAGKAAKSGAAENHVERLSKLVEALSGGL